MDSLRQHLIELLTGENSHVGFEKATKGLNANLQGKKPQGIEHSAWELLEHLRLAQLDILEFSRNPKHVSPEFPAGYWPKESAPPDVRAWDRSVAEFERDLKQMAILIANESNDLTAKLAHGEGQTLLREALVLADHNAYHLGALVQLRRLLGAWKA